MGPLMLDIQGEELTEEESAILAMPEVGGLILFARNYRHPEQLHQLISQIREARVDLLIAVDQEGGRVQRFREGFERLPSLQQIADVARSRPEQSEDICFSFGWLMAAEVLAAGLDISFAPVLDLDRDSCKAISDRSFSEDPGEAILMGRAYLRGMREAGMASTAKHFPGHGSVAGDSHEELPVDFRSMDEVRSRDMLPFFELHNDYDALMPGHLKFPNIDALPVGFSAYWLKQIVRNELGFGGVIFSDDLTMEGAAASGSYSERARLALEAGCDMLLVCNNPDGAREVLHYLQDCPPSGWADSAKRLSSMRSRKCWTREEVMSSDHYSRARRYLELIRNNQCL